MARLSKTPRSSKQSQDSYKRTPLNTYYRSKNENLPASPFERKPLKKNHRRFVIGIVDILVIILLLAGLINSLMLSSNPSVSVTDLTYRSAKVYSAEVRTSFGGYKNHNKVTFEEQAVISKIQNQFPEVQAVQIELPFFSEQPKAKLIISPPAFKITSNNQAFVVDSQGVAVAKAETLPTSKNLVTLNDQSGFNAQLGRQILSTQSVQFIQSLITQTQHAKVPISSLSLPALPQELDLHISDQSYFVKFYLGGDADLQLGQFLASRQKFAQAHITPSEYLDVRVSGKVFYK